MAKRDLRELPELEGWLTFPDAAAELGISRQRFHQLAEKTDPVIIETACRAGRRSTGIHYFVREAEIAELKRRREGGQVLWTD